MNQQQFRIARTVPNYFLKTLIITTFFVCISFFSSSQEIVLDGVRDKLEKIYLQYCDGAPGFTSVKKITKVKQEDTKIVSWSTFDSVFKNIYVRVGLTTDDMLKNGTGYSLSLDQYKKTLSVNYSRARKFKNQFLNFGLNASSSEKTFALFSESAWSKNYGASFGWTWVTNRNIFFKGGDCSEISSKRKEVYTKWMGDFVQYLSPVVNTTKAKIARYEAIQPGNVIDSQAVVDLRTFSSAKDYEEAKEFIKKADAFNSALSTDANLQMYLQDKVDELDRKNYTKPKYSLHWLDLKLNTDYKGNLIYDSVMYKADKPKVRGYFKPAITFSYNYFRFNKYINYFSGGVSFALINYIDGMRASNLMQIDAIVNGNRNVNKSWQPFIAPNYDQFKSTFPIFNPFANYNLFFLNKTLGVELAGDVKWKIGDKSVEFNNLFSLRGGILLSIDGEKTISKSTFGILVIYKDVPMTNVRVQDYFTLNLRLNVPVSF